MGEATAGGRAALSPPAPQGSPKGEGAPVPAEGPACAPASRGGTEHAAALQEGWGSGACGPPTELGLPSLFLRPPFNRADGCHPHATQCAGTEASDRSLPSAHREGRWEGEQSKSTEKR